MNEARGVSARGGGQLIARVGDLRQQVHGFGVGGSSRRERYSTEAIAYGSHGFVVFPRLGSCFLDWKIFGEIFLWYQYYVYPSGITSYLV